MNHSFAECIRLCCSQQRMCFILSDAPSLSLLFRSPINFISTMEQKLLHLVWLSISIENTHTHRQLSRLIRWNTKFSIAIIYSIIDWKQQFCDGFILMIFYQLIWEIISVGNPTDVLFQCHQHLNLRILILKYPHSMHCRGQWIHRRAWQLSEQ